MGFLTSLFAASERRSLENPSTPLSAPDDWLYDSLGSFRASSGVNINRETALTYDCYWRCVSLVSGDVAKLPLCVYRKVKGDAAGDDQGDEDTLAPANAGKMEDEQHPAYRLLRYEACPEISALQWKRLMAFHAISEGNGYSFILRDGAGRPLELWPLSPMKTYPVRENRRLWYVTEVGATQRKIPAENIFHLMGPSFDGLVGYSCVSKMRETLGLALAAENFGSIFFRNNARPNVVLKHPGRLKPEAKSNLRESWERMHSGLENAHRTAVLEEGMDVVTLMHNARDSQLLELKGFSRVQVCNFFGVPPHKVGAATNTSYGSLEQENESYVEDGGGLGYWLPAFATECWRKLLSEQEKQALSHTVEFERRHLLRANLQTRSAYYVSMIQNGVLSPNEVRAEEGYNPREGGDQYVTPTSPHTAAQAQGGGGQGDGKGGNEPAAGDGKQLPPPKRNARGSPDQPRDPDGKFGEGGGAGKADKVKQAKETFAAAIRANTDLPADKRQEYYGAAKGVFEAMPEKAVERYNANTAGHRFHGSTGDLTAALQKDIPGLKLSEGSAGIGGAYRPRTKVLELDGGVDTKHESTREIYAHEMTHAVDGPAHELSSHADWQAAYKDEIAGGKLSAYAKKSPAEGFAEFGRVLYGGNARQDLVEHHFPKAAKFFKDRGLWPEGGSASGRSDDDGWAPEDLFDPDAPDLAGDGSLIDVLLAPAGDDETKEE